MWVGEIMMKLYLSLLGPYMLKRHPMIAPNVERQSTELSPKLDLDGQDLEPLANVGSQFMLWDAYTGK